MRALSRIVQDGAGNQHFIPIPARRKKEGANKDCAFSLRKFLRSWAHLVFYSKSSCAKKRMEVLFLWEKRKTDTGGQKGEYREKVYYTEFEVTRGHPVENSCWKLEKAE